VRLASLALLPFISAAAWGQIHVPGDHPDPQSAVDAAIPGDVIVVHGGTWTAAGLVPALVIDKPLTLIGDPAPTFEPPFSGGTGYQPPAIRLAGPGSGTVTLANVRTGGQTSGITWSHMEGGLAGGGFAEVHVYDSTIAAPAWISLTGVGAGATGSDVDVAYLLLSGCDVSASDGADDGCYGSVPDGDAGVRSTGTVVVLDSDVAGGSYRQPCFFTPGCQPITSGDGGPGIVATRVDEAGSSITGGPGAQWSDVIGTSCGSAADGPAVVATTHVALANDLTVARPTRIGGAIALAWTTPGPWLYLVVSAPAHPRTLRPALGQAYLAPARARLVGLFTSGPTGSTQIALPALPALLGIELTFQGVDPPGHVTRPVSVIVMP
jgi:hypothetical protein